MIAYLVLTRKAPRSSAETGLDLYVAAFETENEALEATLSSAPAGAAVDAVVGPASARLLTLLQLEPGMVVRLSEEAAAGDLP